MQVGGGNQEIQEKLAELETLIEQTRQLRASLESYGMVKLSSANDVTDSTGLALPVTEKNPEIDGTLANEINQLKQNNFYKEILLSEAGWYRIAKYYSSGDATCKGAGANGCTIQLKRSYNYTNNEIYKIIFDSVYEKSKFKFLSGLCNYNAIGKIRHTVDINSSCSFIEIHYTTSSLNNICCYFENVKDEFGIWKAISPEKTEDYIEGVLVFSQLDIQEELNKQ